MQCCASYFQNVKQHKLLVEVMKKCFFFYLSFQSFTLLLFPQNCKAGHDSCELLFLLSQLKEDHNVKRQMYFMGGDMTANNMYKSWYFLVKKK